MLATVAKTSGKYHHFQVKVYVMKGPTTFMRSRRNGQKREGKLWKNASFY